MKNDIYSTHKIKSVETKRYSVSLLQAPSSLLFYIECITTGDAGSKTISDGIKDYKTADYAFEQKVMEYEGN